MRCWKLLDYLGHCLPNTVDLCLLAVIMMNQWLDAKINYPRVAVSAVIVEEGKILLIKRGHEPNEGLWSLPGGSIELGETAREAVAREVLEETSLMVNVGEVAIVSDVISKDGDEIAFHYVIISFFAKVVGGELKAASDAQDARWVDLSDNKYPTTSGLVDRLIAIGLF